MTRHSTSAARRVITLITVGVLGLTACSSTTVRGNAQKDPNVAADAVIPSLLNPGNYPTTPQAALGTAGDARRGGWAESRRMAEFVVMPFEVDPELSGNGPSQSGVIKDSSALSLALPDSVVEGTKHTLVAGFTTVSDTPKKWDPKTDKMVGPPLKSLQNTVLRFGTPAEASAAAADFAARSSTIKVLRGEEPRATQPITIPRHPETLAVSYTPDDKLTIYAYTARGPYVLTQTTIAKAGSQVAAELAAAALDKQIALIDRFEPTPVDKLADLPLDPDGLLARTLASEEPKVSMGVYGAHGALAFSGNPELDQKLWSETGVDLIARSESTVMRAKDADGAGRITRQVAEAAGNLEDSTSEPGPPGMLAARCFVHRAGTLQQHFCIASADRYAFYVVAGKDVVAHQQLTAQYLMLTAQ